MAISAIDPAKRSIFSFVKMLRPPKVGELRTPISLYSSDVKPVIPTDGSTSIEFSDDDTPFLNCWSKVANFQSEDLDGEDTEANLSTVFIIRNPGSAITIGARSFVLWNQQIYIVRGTRGVEDASTITKDDYKFILLLCDDFEKYNKEAHTTEQSTAPVTGVVDPNNPLWR